MTPPRLTPARENMKARTLTWLCLLTLPSCQLVESVAGSAKGILGIPDAQVASPATSAALEALEAIPANEYHAARIAERRAAILEILNHD